jgi:hypothetical protein
MISVRVTFKAYNTFYNDITPTCKILWMAATTAINSAYILFMHEAQFTRDCITNKRKSHSSAQESQHQVAQRRFQQ